MSNRVQTFNNLYNKNNINNGGGGSTRRRKHYQKSRHNPLGYTAGNFDNLDVLPSASCSLDADARYRCRSEGEILKRCAANEEEAEAEFDDYDDDESIKSINHSTYSVPTTMKYCKNSNNHGIQYKKRLLMKYHREQQFKNTDSAETDKSIKSASISIEAEMNVNYYIFKIF